jgi:hypothetical protein
MTDNKTARDQGIRVTGLLAIAARAAVCFSAVASEIGGGEDEDEM